MAIDKELIIRKLKMIFEDMNHLQRLSKLSLEDYLANFENEVLAERYLERIIGRLIDINYHIICESNEAPPSDYYSSFITMGKLNIISAELATKLAHCAGLRNHLAHEYNGIDEKLIYQAIKTCFDDLPLYLEAINRFITAV
jgi:uncharacterized protein YutE (UPF0331/DUF86 family)